MIEFFKISAGTCDELIQQLSLISKLALSFRRHGKPFVKPTRYRPAGRYPPDEYVRGFVPQDILESIARIAWRTGGKEDYEVQLSNGISRNPWWNGTR